jgi:amino acid adenylation domain-containing protein/FkbM family methyltransferase
VASQFTRERTYWLNKLAGDLVKCGFPGRCQESLPGKDGTAEQPLSLGGGLFVKLRQVADGSDAKLHLLLVTALVVLLHRYSYDRLDDIVVGVPIYRQDVAGDLVNTVLALRNRLRPGMTFGQLLLQVYDTMFAAVEHQNYPLDVLLEQLGLTVDGDGCPLFDVVMMLENIHDPAYIRHLDPGLVFSFLRTEESLEGCIRYDAARYEKRGVERIGRHFVRLLRQALFNVNITLRQIDILSAADRRHLLSALDHSAAAHPGEKTLHRLFGERAAERPDRTALVFGSEQLSYGALNEKAERLAGVLRLKGVKADVPVGLLLEPSFQVIWGILGILKAGGGYLPIDPDYPAQRVEYMLADSCAAVLLSRPDRVERLRQLPEVIDVGRLDGPDCGPSPQSPHPGAAPSSLAYIIYTSGTTGRPKGALIGHDNVVRLLFNDAFPFAFDHHDAWTLFHSCCFDFSVWEMYGALLYGGKLVLIDRMAARDPARFLKILKREGVTVLNQTPSAFYHLSEEESKSRQPTLRLRYVIFGGEALTPGKLRGWRNRYPQTRLVNMFGITETTVHVTYKEVGERDIERNIGSIGRPIPTLSAYIVDRHMGLLPIGVPGELCIGGAGVCRGYLNQPELAGQKFTLDPHKPGERLYRSGDLVRLLESGELEYLGRIDQQVKIRGYRVELAEIENQLLAYPAVKEAVVDLRQEGDNGKRLTAYVVPDAACASAVRQFIRLQAEREVNNRLHHVCANGLALFCLNRHETEFMYREIFEEHIYLKHGIGLGDGACIFDIGANIGLFSILASLVCDRVEIQAFEPLPPIYEVLALNASLFGRSIEANQLAIADRQGEAVFTYYPHSSVLSGRYADKQEETETVAAFIRNQLSAAGEQDDLAADQIDDLLAERLSSTPFTCPLKTLSQVIEEKGVKRIDLLKIDVEKGELDVLNGIDQDHWPIIGQLVVEVHQRRGDGRLAKIVRLLEERGYRVTVEQDNILKDTDLYNLYARRPGWARQPLWTAQRLQRRLKEKTGGRWYSPERLIDDLRNHLKEKLPAFMVPAYFRLLEALPLTGNGKLDRKALASLEVKPGGGPQYVTPKTGIERQIAAIWQEVLRLDGVGLEDNFFDLGGHSLDLIKVNARLKETFTKEITIARMFQYPTVGQLARYFDSPGKGAAAGLGEEAEAGIDTAAAVAVIGLAGRFPGANNIDEFWENLENGREAITFFADEELAAEGFGPELLADPLCVKARGILEDVDYFDAAFFGYTPKEAEIMDPQMRLFHECAWEALENAGYDPESYPGLVGVYAGASNSFVPQALAFMSGQWGWEESQLNDKDYISTRVSYKLNLRGESCILQTACSTSMVAIHHACRALTVGECHMALAGGITILLPQKQAYLYQEGLILSPDGRCRAFDERANGTVGGNGVGIVVLKPLARAEAERDFIHAVVKGTAINNDGSRKVGFTAPGVSGQAEVIRRAQQQAGVKPGMIGFIEAHGTGTPLGDAVEIEALKLAFNTDRRQFCAIGSVKSGVGHLECAAGVAGFIKAVLALKHRLIPPSLHVHTPNPRIDFENSPFYVNTQLSAWKHDGTPRRAGVSSFGLGGTNVHVVLEEAPRPVQDGASAAARPYQLLLLSAKTETSLLKGGQRLARHLRANPGIHLADVAYTLQVGRRPFKYRQMAVCPNSGSQEAAAALSADSGTGPKSTIQRLRQERRPVVFMFSAQGSQYVNMGLELYRSEPQFRRLMDSCFDILETTAGYDIKGILYPDGQTEAARQKIDDVLYSGPVKFVFEYSLAALLRQWGLKPHALIGHSFGEYTAACTAGVFSLEDALALVVLRGQLMQKTPPGIMMSAALSPQALRPLLGDDISLAAVNADSLCIVSGPCEAVRSLEAKLVKQGIDCVKINFPHASHSRMMAPITGAFKKRLTQVTLNKPQIPYISGLSGQWITVQQATDPAYWARHLTDTIRFSEGLRVLLEEPGTVFIQPGPDRGLPLFLSHHTDIVRQNPTFNLVRHPKEAVPDARYLFHQLGSLWLQGVDIDWPALHHGQARRRLPLPTYAFDRTHFPREYNLPVIARRLSMAKERPQLVKEADMSRWFYFPSWELSLLPNAEGGGIAPGSVTLVFMEEGELGLHLKRQLADHRCPLITVSKGAHFEKRAAGAYALNPRAADDYRRLLAELCRLDMIPAHIILLWPLVEGSEPFQFNRNMDDTLQNGLYSLVLLARTIHDFHLLDETIHILVVTNNIHQVSGDEEIFPDRAAVLGAVRDIPLVFPSVYCTNIDLLFPPCQGVTPARMAGQILSELTVQPSKIRQVTAYRGQQRWVQVFKPLPLPPGSTDTPYLRQQGVYLITGGLGDHGSIGYILARYLAKQVKARLVLAARTDLPPREKWPEWLNRPAHHHPLGRKIRWLRELEEAGAEVLTVRADVGDLRQVKRLVRLAEKRFGPINGIIHAAAVMRGKSISYSVEDVDFTEYERQFRPKISGLANLYEVFKERDFDFCLLTSSIAALIGPYPAYAAANNFLDASARWLNRRNPGAPRKWISVNWDNWLRPDTTWSEAPRLAMTPDEGVEAFHRILSRARIDQVIVSTAHPDLRIKEAVARVQPAQDAPFRRKSDIADWFYIPRWKRLPLPAGEGGGTPKTPGNWLVFGDGSDLARRLVGRLEEDGHRVITVVTGQAFNRPEREENPPAFTLNPADESGYHRLFGELARTGRLPDCILHLWNVTGTHIDLPDREKLEKGTDLAGVEDMGIYSLQNIARAIGHNSIDRPIRLGVVSAHMQCVAGQESLYPLKAAVLGPVKIIPLEYSNIACRSIDIDYPWPGEDGGQENMVEQIIREFAADFPDNPVVAYRQGQRFVQGYRPLRLEPADGVNRGRLTEEGVYLVTGGSGGMGFTLACHLAGTLKARLVLVDIADFLPWQRQRIAELEEKGARFLVQQADVSDYGQMAAVIQETHKRFGRLDGVIHAAGLIDYGGVIQRRSRRETEKLLAPKVRGTLVLDALLKSAPVKPAFLVLFSSLGNMLYRAKFGQVAYNAGHEFLDIFAHYKQKDAGGTFTVTIDWNDWLEVGMAVKAAKNDAVADEVLSISPSEGIAVFERILAHHYPQVAVSSHDLCRMIAYMKEAKDDAALTGTTVSEYYPRPELNAPYAAPGSDGEARLVEIWQDFFCIEPIGIHDNFFELGGDSLKAVNLLARIHKELNVKIPLPEIFNKPTIADLSPLIVKSAEDRFTRIPPTEKREYYPLSSSQSRMYVYQQMHPDNTTYNMLQVRGLPGNVGSKERLACLFKKLTHRHEALRTSFDRVGGEPVQRVAETGTVDIQIEDFRLKESGEAEIDELAEIARSFIRPFDLSHLPLFRVGLIDRGRQIGHILLVDIHHIITDGLSNGLITRDFLALFEDKELAPLRLQYKDYCQWRHKGEQQQAMGRQEVYWLAQLGGKAGSLPVLALPTDYERPETQSFEGDLVSFEVDRQQTGALKELAKSRGTTLYVVLLAIYNVLLAKLSRQEDIVVGTVVAGRRRPDLKQIVGNFINTLVLRNYPGAEKTFREFLRETGQRTIEAFENQDYPIEDLVKKLVKNREVNRNGLFDAGFQLLDQRELPEEDLKFRAFANLNGDLKREDLFLEVWELGDRLLFSFIYWTKLFRKETIREFAGYFKKIVSTVIEEPGKRLKEIEILPEEEKDKIGIEIKRSQQGIRVDFDINV